MVRTVQAALPRVGIDCAHAHAHAFMCTWHVHMACACCIRARVCMAAWAVWSTACVPTTCADEGVGDSGGRRLVLWHYTTRHCLFDHSSCTARDP